MSLPRKFIKTNGILPTFNFIFTKKLHTYSILKTTKANS